MIRIVIGALGAGKTAWSTRDAIREADRGIPQIVNWPVDHPNVIYAGSWDEMKQHTGAHCRIDEAYRWFPRTQYQSTTADDLAYYKQSRHEGVSLDLLCHRTNDVHTGIFAIASEVIVIRRPFGPTPQDEPGPVEHLIGAWSLVWKYYGDGFETPTKRAVKSLSVFCLESAWGSYARYNIVGRKDGQGARVVHRRGTSAHLAAPGDTGEVVPECVRQLVRQERSGCPSIVRYVRSLESSILDARGGGS